MYDAKAEFISCLKTGVLGFLLSAGFISGVYHLNKEVEKESKPVPKKVLKASQKETVKLIDHQRAE